MDFIKDLSIDSIRNIAEDAYNQAKPKTELEKKIYEVLSHKNWGSSSTLLNEIAENTYDFDKFPVITKMMWEGMDNRPAAWRIVFKSLTLLEHLIKNGSERCVDEARGRTHQLRGLDNFNYYEGTVDRGLGVREKSKQILELLEDDERIREERSKAKKLREKFGGMSSSSAGGGGGGGFGNTSSSKYAGYGNDSDFRSSGYGNSSGGYSDSGGGSGSGSGSGGYGNGGLDSYNDGKSKGFSGRYADQDSTSNATKSQATPTFATLPEDNETEEKPVKKSSKPKKLKKKKKKESSGTGEAPEVDLFSFDTSATSSTPAAETGEDDFGAFDSAPKQETNSSDAAFDAFASAASPVSAPNTAFDAFSSQPQKSSSTTPAFDAFSSSIPTQTPVMDAPIVNDPFASVSESVPVNQVNQMGGTMGMMQNQNLMNMMQRNQMNMMQQNQMNMMQQNQMNVMQQNLQMMNNMGGNPALGVMGGSTSKNIMGGGQPKKLQQQKQEKDDDEDDFGDFSGSNNNTNANLDPMSKLIQLDSLTLNSKKNDKTKEPVIYNEAAATALKTSMATGSTSASDLSFTGLDGLNKQVNISIKQPVSNRQPGQPIMSEVTNNNMIGGMQGGMNMGMGMGMGMNQQQQGMAMMGGFQGNNMMMGNNMTGMQGNNMMPNMGGMGGMGGQGMMMNNVGGMGGMNGMNMNSMGGNNMMMGNMGGMGMNMKAQSKKDNNMNNMGGMAGGMMGGQAMNGWR